jgi:hypothetical protein
MLFVAQARLAAGDSLLRVPEAALLAQIFRHSEATRAILRSYFSEPGIESLLLMSAE